MSQRPTTNESKQSPICWTCRFLHRSNTRDLANYECTNPYSRKYLESKEHRYIPRSVMDNGCSKWESKRHYKPAPKAGVESNQKKMFG